ncbi:MAG: hypothetical protein FWG57_02550 [Endomicrobia bacterium]|nr:hypothetical protein [Endomicrobiia bacterium]
MKKTLISKAGRKISINPRTVKTIAALAIALLEIVINFLPDRPNSYENNYYDHYQ